MILRLLTDVVKFCTENPIDLFDIFEAINSQINQSNCMKSNLKSWKKFDLTIEQSLLYI